MFNLIKSKFTKTSVNPDAEALVDEFAKQQPRNYARKLKEFTAGVRYEHADPQFQRDVAMAMLKWLEIHPRSVLDRHDPGFWMLQWKMRELFLTMLKRKLPFTEQDVLALLEWSVNTTTTQTYFRGIPQVIKVVGDYLKDNEISDNLSATIDRLINVIQPEAMSVEPRRWVLRLKELKGDTELTLPLAAGDVWADQAISDIKALEPGKQTAWVELLLHCLRAAGSAPSESWTRTAGKHLDVIESSDFYSALVQWFPLADKPRTEVIDIPGRRDSLLPANADILKGLVWLCGKSADPELVRLLTELAISSYRKIPGLGPRAGKVGNACFWALANTPGMDGAAQLSILKQKIKTKTAQKLIARSLAAAARRVGMTHDELEEISVPAYGMEEVGLRRDQFGSVVSALRVIGKEVEQSWTKEDGKRLSSVPKVVKEKYPGDLKEISRVVKDIRRMLPVQRHRIDNLCLGQTSWTFPAWQSRYINHPLVGTIGRRLIWKFSQDDKAASAIWSAGQMVGRDNQSIDWIHDSTMVELWHPLHSDADVVLEWRQWLIDHEISQPFKQAYREIYLLTDAELNTRVYSNRYAAHILRQHQFNSLCAARGWRNALRLMVDGDLPPASKILPQWGLRAEYWIEGIGDMYGVDTNKTGTFLYVTTDQVRFYRMDAVENRAQAGGGGYSARRLDGQGNAEPLPLAEIPPLVFSEIMRDVDMFVGVASIGNDPNWLDGGAEVRYRDYWQGYSFGELTESSKTRKVVLERLVPRLKIAGRCELTDKFLVVRGDILTYKIHLGSGNILMEPNDQYLCIVPARRNVELGKGNLFVPFEGDQTLSIILSKAFLLAEDKKIADPTITRQLRI
jgi:uncharacterized protein DUF4132